MRKASVIAYWPSAPATPMPAISHRSSPRIGTHCGQASTPAPTAIIAISQTIIDWVLSVRARMRTVIALTEYISRRDQHRQRGQAHQALAGGPQQHQHADQADAQSRSSGAARPSRRGTAPTSR